MKTLHRMLLALAAPVLAAGACARGDAKAPPRREVVVFAAASLRESLEELGRDFQRQTGADVTFNFAGSNDLAHQIDAARGMDVFLSASTAWMDTVQHHGRVVAGTRRDLLSNTLVVVASPQSPWTVGDPCALGALPFKHLAVGDPQAVPAGIYAKRWMSSVDCHGKPLWDAIEARVAPTPDVRAALGLVLADPEVVGMVYRTDQLAFAGRTRVLFEVRDGPPIRYALAQVAEGANPEDARRFLDYLSGPEAARVFARHGFTPLISPAPAAR
jgi:molybdate transport system substrate-binding protein